MMEEMSSTLAALLSKSGNDDDSDDNQDNHDNHHRGVFLTGAPPKSSKCKIT